MPGEPAQDVIVVPELLTLELVRRHFIPLAPRTIFRWISAGSFPKADVVVGSKVRLWKRETIEGWISSRSTLTVMGLPGMSPENYSVPGGRP